MKEMSINYDIGFADSKILSYIIKNNKVILNLECWNAQILEVIFKDFVELSMTNETLISDFQELFESPLLEKAINEIYDEKPKIHNLKVFRLLDINDLNALEVVCESIQIGKISIGN